MPALLFFGPMARSFWNKSVAPHSCKPLIRHPLKLIAKPIFKGGPIFFFIHDLLTPAAAS
jgi:hypothetical protein